MPMMSENKILVIIPAYNEEGSVGRVIGEVRKCLPRADVLVVNDGSTDLTSEKAKASGAIVLDLPFNLGIGGAMQAGYKYAYEKGIPKLLEVLAKKRLDMAIGSRFISNSEYKSSPMRKVGISLLSKVISMIVGQKITDPTSGFRAVRRKAIKLFAADYPQDYPEPEALVLLSRSSLKMKEVPVEMNQRYSGVSSITKIRSIYYMVKVLLAVFVDCFKKRPFEGSEDKRC
jgi:glycosyltransferase involved in cell wall biosynthesis